MRHNARLTHSSICTICNNAGGFKGSAKSESKVFEL